MSKILREIRVILIVTFLVLLLVPASGAGDVPDLAILSLTVNKAPASDCSYLWQAVVRNNAATSLPVGASVSATASQGRDGSDWSPAGSGLITYIAGAGEKGINDISFVRLADKNQLKLELVYNGTEIDEQIINLPDEPQPSFGISNCELTATGYTARVRNLLSESISDFSVQGFSASAESPNSWEPSGNEQVGCLGTNGVYEYSGMRPAENEIIKISISRGGSIVREEIFNLSSSSSGESSQHNLMEMDNQPMLRPATDIKTRLPPRKH